MPATLKKFQAIQRKKKAVCAGRAKKADLNKVVKTYVDAAVKGGQTKAEATAKANRIVNRKCSIAAKPSKASKPRSRARA